MPKCSVGQAILAQVVLFLEWGILAQVVLFLEWGILAGLVLLIVGWVTGQD